MGQVWAHIAHTKSESFVITPNAMCVTSSVAADVLFCFTCTVKANLIKVDNGK